MMLGEVIDLVSGIAMGEQGEGQFLCRLCAEWNG
jgi:hypothetical protein